MRKGAAWLLAAVLGLSACGADDDDAAGGSGGSVPGGSGGSATAGSSTAGTGTAGMGTAGMGTAGMSGATGACAGASTAPPAMLHAAAQAALGGMTASCGLSSSCHQGAGKAGLVLKDKTDMRMLMLNKMSCEAPNVPLVDGRGGETALNNSWLYLKLAAPLDASSNLMANTMWGTPGNCGQITVGSFGQRMPQGLSGTMTWQDLQKIKDWICAGAPGPM